MPLIESPERFDPAAARRSWASQPLGLRISLVALASGTLAGLLAAL